MNARPTKRDSRARVLVVDDDRTQADALGDVLELEGFDVVRSHSGREALEASERFTPDVVVSDFRMSGMSGLELFQELGRRGSRSIFILTTAFGTLETAVEAMRSGVHDFITKPVNSDELIERIRKALHLRTLEDENEVLRETVDSLRQGVTIVGESPQIKEILATVRQVAPSQATILLEGESGTGKELVARAIHLSSPRSKGPFIRVNCAAIPENLIESELFGHVKGAFTGAVASRPGKFQLADGGTILLDEVGDLPLHLQPKILRVLQEREVEPVGAGQAVKVDLRVIAATHQDLPAMVEDGRFRKDLFYRLSVIPIRIPPLRERPGDVTLLARHFMRRYCDANSRKLAGFTEAALEKLEACSWPGNVRELQNCIERAVVLARGDTIDADDLLLAPPPRDEAVDAVVDALFATDLTLDDLERRIILAALDRMEGNVSRTARVLGLSRRALQYRRSKIEDAEPEESDSGDRP